MAEEPIKLLVIIGSIRGGRFGPVVSRWFTRQATKHGGVEVQTLDLLDHPLPLRMPAYGEQPEPEVGKVYLDLSAKLAWADAFVVITAEYNHSVPASLKNAIDWFRAEWVAKPIGLVSYGGMGGGLRAAEHLRQVFAELHAMTVRDMLSFHNAWAEFARDGEPTSPDGSEEAAKALLDQLVWWGTALREAREKSPYTI
ncbi:MAG TPA: NAD(P)H-dependent oxidoreductase [Jatrophihabitans sp.]|jgi:NAD(P)H-dependent FMN reductase|nr:NAD(P)H-dependent oxidoreductase [Jatrophihabitans sp.]